MKRRTIIGIIVTYVVVMIGVYASLLQGTTVSLFSTQGTIADQEKHLIIFTVLLGCTVVLPVLVMTFAIAWRYREGNTKAVYRPDWSGSKLAEGVWWTIPTIIIAILAVVIVQSSHTLDPYKELSSTVKPLHVQVVALQWRWLFIYPDAGVASINHLMFPVDTPVNFTLTSDAPMNSFWIPQLSGQVYAMSGMSSQLHLGARTIGDYRGSSANMSGRGFAGMDFTASAVSRSDFDAWTNLLRNSSNPLGAANYGSVSAKTCDKTVHSYNLADANLYNEVINKYMDPSSVPASHQMTDATSAPASCQHKTIIQTVTDTFSGSK